MPCCTPGGTSFTNPKQRTKSVKATAEKSISSNPSSSGYVAGFNTLSKATIKPCTFNTCRTPSYSQFLAAKTQLNSPNVCLSVCLSVVKLKISLPCSQKSPPSLPQGFPKLPKAPQGFPKLPKGSSKLPHSTPHHPGSPIVTREVQLGVRLGVLFNVQQARNRWGHIVFWLPKSTRAIGTDVLGWKISIIPLEMSPSVIGNSISGIFKLSQLFTNYSPFQPSYITNQPFEKASLDRSASVLSLHCHLKLVTCSFGQEC